MIALDDVDVRIGDKVLLDRVSLELLPGEFLAVAGPNGAGKSTLMRVACGERPPTGGVVRFAGKPLAEWRIDELARRRAVLPQHTSSAFEFRTLEVVLLGRTPHNAGLERPIDRRVAESALKEVELSAFAERSVTTLSGGESQRTHLARALAQTWDLHGAPTALLLDEPTSNLDLLHQLAVLETARRWARAGAAVLCVLHDLNLCSQFADRIALLHQGRLVALDTPAAVLTEELIGDVYGIACSVRRHPEGDLPWVYPALVQSRTASRRTT